MSKKAFKSRAEAFSKLKGEQRIVKRKSIKGRTVFVLRSKKCKHLNKSKISKIDGRGQLRRNIRKGNLRSKGKKSTSRRGAR